MLSPSTENPEYRFRQSMLLLKGWRRHSLKFSLKASKAATKEEPSSYWLSPLLRSIVIPGMARIRESPAGAFCRHLSFLVFWFVLQTWEPVQDTLTEKRDFSAKRPCTFCKGRRKQLRGGARRGLSTGTRPRRRLLTGAINATANAQMQNG